MGQERQARQVIYEPAGIDHILPKGLWASNMEIIAHWKMHEAGFSNDRTTAPVIKRHLQFRSAEQNSDSKESRSEDALSRGSSVSNRPCHRSVLLPNKINAIERGIQGSAEQAWRGFLIGITAMVSTGYRGRATKQAEWNRAGPLLWVKHAERSTSGIAATENVFTV